MGHVGTSIMYPGFTFVTLQSMLYYLSGAVGTEAVRHGKIRGVQKQTSNYNMWNTYSNKCA